MVPPSAHPRTRRRFENPSDIRFLTFSCYRRLALFENPRIKDAFIEELSATHRQMNFKLFGYVVMPEHVHLLVQPSPPDTTVTTLLMRLKSQFAHQVIQRWRTLAAPILNRLRDASGHTRFWQPGGGYDRNLVSSENCHEKLNYLHQNPVRRGLVTHPDQWIWSSARAYANHRHTPAIQPDRLPL